MAQNDNRNAQDRDVLAYDAIKDGGVADKAKTPRMKIGFGNDNFYKDVSNSNPFPTIGLTGVQAAAGQLFFAGVQKTLASGIINNVLIVTPASPNVIMIFEVEATLDTDIQLFEDTTTSAQGSAVSEFNVNRQSATVAQTIITDSPTITADGTLLIESVIVSGRNDLGGGGTAEFILKTSAQYLLRVTSASNSNIVDQNFAWSEIP